MILTRICALFLLGAAVSGCGIIDKLKGGGVDAGDDAAVDAAPPVTVVEDAGVDAAVVRVEDDIPAADPEDQRANRDIGFGNFKEELDKLEKEFANSQKKK